MSGLLHPILRKLADGRFHSGARLGEELQVSRAAVWKTIQKLQDLGLDVHSVRGKGYRLQHPVNLLEPESIQTVMPADCRRRIQQLDILDTVDSTNSRVMQMLQEGQLVPEAGQYAVLLAEQQTHGKGRRGRHWVSPWGENIYLTMARLVDTGSMSTEGISLVVGLAVLRALRGQGVNGAGIKWPNDVLWEEKKLAGILLEITGDISGLCQLVIGVGINTHCRPDAMQQVEQPWTDLQKIKGTPTDRNLLAGDLITHIMAALDEFEVSGLGSFMGEWEQADVVKNRQVELLSAESSRFGKAVGISASGALLLETPEGIQEISGGEISLRSVAAP